MPANRRQFDAERIAGRKTRGPHDGQIERDRELPAPPYRPPSIDVYRRLTLVQRIADQSGDGTALAAAERDMGE